MSGYTKLFGSILASTVWELPATTKVVWITMLAMADRHGEIQASVPGLAKFAGVTREECEAALAAFMAPDPDSRTKDDDGRRVRELDGGWYLVNHRKYTQTLSDDDKRERAAERKRRSRESHSVTLGHASSHAVTLSTASHDTQTQTQTQTKTEDLEQILAPLGVPVLPAEFLLIWEGTGKHGDREPALKAWKKRGKPSWSSLSPVWAAYMLSERPVAGFVKDLSTWFNKGCHLQDWQPARAPPRPARNGSVYQQTIDSMQGFLKRHEGDD